MTGRGLGWLASRRRLGRRHQQWQMGPLQDQETVLVFDSFSGADGTELTAHLAEIDRLGGGWVQVVETSGSLLLLQSNRLEVNFSESGTRVALAYLNTGKADVQITASMTAAAVSSAHSINLVGRRVDNLNSWHVLIDGIGRLSLYEKVNGGYNLRASAAGLTPGAVYDVAYSLRGTLHTARAGGKTISYSGSLGQTRTQHGVRIFQLSAALCFIDTFKIMG